MKLSTIDQEATLFAAIEVALPADSVSVVRWVSGGEAEMWELNPNSVPVGLHGGDDWLPVAVPWAARPDRTGRLRLEFSAPAAMLIPRTEAGWLYLKAGSEVFNLRIVGPRSHSNNET